MSQQPEALRLADWIESEAPPTDEASCADVAAELRRLYEMNQELLNALEFVAAHDLSGADLAVCGHIAHGFVGMARAAITKAEGKA